ncbi:EAL and HDOD domain-containing protein [Denitromonas iodatirespirans]|uniref:HDOD domain-containing protein n=1 Tax=Denitromonas iodatirespirans TaxID=2795389 RepID=A0A944D831_DENI1|nr:HDOD domain-containing protein [Denitromonas iodatirespirans]MBT0959758.1 HDOD domain-containing protein [Denitromonas iodatirespirans]
MSQTLLLTREPVVNRNRAITANRLIAHAPSVADAVEGLKQFEEEWPRHHSVFLSLGKLVPTVDLLEWTMPDNLMVEIPAPTLAHPKTQELLPQLKAAGVSTCLSWYTADTVLPAEADWRFVIMDQRKEASPLHCPGLSLAWGLKDTPAFDDAIHRGFDGAAGWFFLQGNAPAKQLSPSHAQLVRLLNLVRHNADVKDIEAVLKQDVALSYKLLRYINSAGFGLMCEIQSFRHAVTILGYNNLNKWLSLLLVTASRDPAAPALMQASIARGRLMERVAAPFFDKADHDNLFITGAFSLLPSLLGTSLADLLGEMSLPEPITDALINNEGAYAPFLNLARACERFDPTRLQALVGELTLDNEAVNRALLAGLQFADSLQA